jgi:nucleoside-diphosphate-sugar epimerase
MDPIQDRNHALIYGASGITGWAIVNELLKGYPDQSPFAKVTALTNRPLLPNASQWPDSDKLQLVSGIDVLAGDLSTLEATLKEQIADVESVTHIYFFAYIANSDPEQEIRLNSELLERGIKTIESLSASLRFVVLPTGTKVRLQTMRGPLALT